MKIIHYYSKLFTGVLTDLLLGRLDECRGIVGVGEDLAAGTSRAAPFFKRSFAVRQSTRRFGGGRGGELSRVAPALFLEAGRLCWRTFSKEKWTENADFQ